MKYSRENILISLWNNEELEMVSQNGWCIADTFSYESVSTSDVSYLFKKKYIQYIDIEMAYKEFQPKQVGL